MRLREVHIASCRHISHSAFCDVFAPDNKKFVPLARQLEEELEVDAPILPSYTFAPTYPELTHMNISFCNTVDAGIVRGIFAKCPSLKKLVAFGCFKILEHVEVPKGRLLVGVPNAQDAIEQVGDDGMGGAFGAGIMGLEGVGDVWELGGRAVEVGA
jgi:DNA repair protein RAD7